MPNEYDNLVKAIQDERNAQAEYSKIVEELTPIAPASPGNQEAESKRPYDHTSIKELIDAENRVAKCKTAVIVALDKYHHHKSFARR